MAEKRRAQPRERNGLVLHFRNNFRARTQKENLFIHKLKKEKKTPLFEEEEFSLSFLKVFYNLL